MRTPGQPLMKIYVPYTNLLQATQIALVEYDYIPVDLKDQAYSDFLRERWAEGESFINIEHDIVPWPGAIEEIAECPEPWCGYAYHTGPSLDPHPYWHPMLGCVKLGAELIRRTAGMWDEHIMFFLCDSTLAERGYAARLSPHRHFPGVVNANPFYINGVRDL